MTRPDEARREEVLKRALFDRDGGRASAGGANMDRELVELREVEARLRAAGRAELERLLLEGADDDLERAAREALERHLEREASSPARRRLAFFLAALAAVLILALGWFAFHRGAETPEGITLGAGGVELVRPLDEESDLNEFVWRGEIPSGGWYEVSVWPAEAGPLDAPLLEARVKEPRWIPEAPQDLPDELRWEVRALGPLNEVLGRAAGRAWRPSP